MTIKVFTVEEMVAAEKAADASGVTYEQMMETAGRSLAEAILERRSVHGKQVLILVGPGNNGGDGLVAGRYLAQAGADVAFYLYRPRDPQEDANFARIREMGLFVVNAGADEGYRELRSRVQATDVLVDALLGTGVDRPIGGELATLLEQVQAGLEERKRAAAARTHSRLTSINEVTPGRDPSARPYVAAVDCPSGLNTDTGHLDPLALPADLTVTFAGPKRGHFYFPGAAACGELVVADIDIDAELAEVKRVPVELATAEMARALLPKRSISGHKGTFGWVLIAAGSSHYWGAPLLAGRGAYRTGAGLVALTVPQAIRPVVAGQLPEATYPPVTDKTDLGTASAGQILDTLDRYQALLFGPGLGRAPDFVKKLLSVQPLPPLVVDADGLNTLSGLRNWPDLLPERTILTPHPGEMARLTGMEIGALKKRERVALAQEKASEWNHVVLLKGAYTVVADPSGRVTIIPFANPLLAAAGSGDVLSGVIVALLGQGLAPYEAAVLGAYLHGAAGQLAGEEIGDAGLLSAEIADWLPEARLRLLANR